MSISVEPNHPLVEILARKMFGIEGVPIEEQTKMVRSAIKSAYLYAIAAEKTVADLRAELQAKDAEIEKLKISYKEASKIIDGITSNDACKGCKNKGTFPSPSCCDCIFDSICKLANMMDEEVIEQALKGNSND